MTRTTTMATTNNNSVYHRAKILSPIFPWLLFSSLFSNQLLFHRCSTRGVVTAAESSVRGTNNYNNNNDNNNNINNDNIININNDHRAVQEVILGMGYYNYCGLDWSDSNGKCSTACPSGESEECPFGETCFADCTSCPSLMGTAAAVNAVNVAVVQQPQLTALPAVVNTNTNTNTAAVVNTNTNTNTNTASPSIPSHCPATTTNTINVGYYQSWSKYRTSTCHPLTANAIPVSTFGYTHLIYSFAGISPSGELEPYNGIMDEVELYRLFNSLKDNDAGLKTLIAVGGWNFDQSRFTTASSTPASRTKFANSVVSFLQLYNFDGIDFDWEYPVTRQGTPADYDNYVSLVREVRRVMDEAGLTGSDNGGSTGLITMAIPCNPDKLNEGYDLPSLAEHLDWFHLMSYDIYGAWDSIAGSNTDMPYIEMTVDYILNQGVDSSQLTLGFASYGRSMKLGDAACATMGCPISGPGMTGCSGEAGFSPYFELMEQYVDTGNYKSLLLNEVTKSMEMVVETPEGEVLVSFDEKESFLMKHDYYLSKCLRGQMWWAVDMIKEKPFPFYGTASSSSSSPAANNVQALSDPSANTNVDTNASPTSQQLAPGVTNNDEFCNGNSGLIPVNDCTGFVFCTTDGKMQGSITECSPGLFFDANMKICNWPSTTNLCGFEFCPKGYTGYTAFETCSKFYFCKDGKIDGDIDVCPEGTLFDEAHGICNWASMVTCNSKPPTMAPTPKATNPPTYARVAVTTPKEEVTPQAVEAGGVASYTNAREEDAAPPPPVTFSQPAKIQDDSIILRFDPSDDAYVQEEQPTTNYNDNYIVVDKNLRFDGLIRFYVQGVKGRKVTNVKLRLFVSNESYFGGNFYACNADWHEDVVVWDNVPSVISQTPLAVVKAAPKGDWIEVDVSGLVTKDGPVALRIISDSSDNVMYSSKENPNGNGPQLLVGVESTPLEEEKSAVVLNTLKIGPTDDTFVFKTTANKNYGRHPVLKVDQDNGFKKSFLRFDFSRVNIAAIDKATLRLYATDSSPSGGVFIKTSDANWSENVITWNDCPTADGVMIGTLGEVEAGSWYELDITEAITESGPLSIAILGSHEDRVIYSSKDGLHSPEIALSLKEAVPQGEVTELFPSDDATITLLQRNTNFGSQNTLEIDARDGMRNILLRFDASEIPQGEVSQAILRIYAINKEPAFGGTFVEVMNSNWKEQTITWDNAPSADGKILGSLMEIEGGSWYDVDVTTAVMGGGPVSFRISSPHSSIGVYGSRESEHQPRLIVHHDTPEQMPDGAQIFNPTDDASILLEKQGGNFGMDDQLKVDGGTGVYNSLLRFDLASIERGTVVQAILRLYAVDGSPSGGTFIQTKDTDWSQYKVTWATAPVANGIVLKTLGEVTPYKWYEIDVTEIVQGGEAISIRIAPSHGNRCAYSSKEDRYGRAPQLMITADMFQGVE